MSIFKSFGNWKNEPPHDIMINVVPQMAQRVAQYFNENQQYDVVVENSTTFYVSGSPDNVSKLNTVLEGMARDVFHGGGYQVIAEGDSLLVSPDLSKLSENVSERIPTEDEMSEISPIIAKSVKLGGENGGGTLSTGEKFYWTLNGTSVANDTFVREYIANLIAEGHSEGVDPEWNITVSVTFSEMVEENLNDIISDMFADEDESIGDDDGLFDVFPDDDGESTAREEGIAAQKSGLLVTDNPYNPLSDDHNAWEGGFNSSSDDDMIETDNDDVAFDMIAPKIPR